jgi:ABC-type transporter Mla MlaB component
MLRMEQSSVGHSMTLRLSGRIQSEHLPELRAQIKSCGPNTVLNLEEVTLVDRAAVRFLGLCESNGVELLHCPLYVGEWILGKKGRNRE